jgi:hypothetical protein
MPLIKSTDLRAQQNQRRKCLEGRTDNFRQGGLVTDINSCIMGYAKSGTTPEKLTTFTFFLCYTLSIYSDWAA